MGISSFEALAMFRRGLFYSYLSIYLRYFLGLSVTETTLFATLPMVLNVICQTFVWGQLSDRLQLRRTLIIIGEILAGLGTLLVWYIHTLTAKPVVAGYVIILGLSLVEILWSMSNVGWSALISDIYRQEERNTIQGRLASIGGLGRIGGVWIGGLLYDGLKLQYEGWGFHEGALFFVATAVMFISVFPLLFVPEGGIRSEIEVSSDHPAEKPDSSMKIFIIFITAMVFINFGRNSIAVIQAQYLVLDTGFAVSSQALSYIVNTQSIAMILTGLIAGWIGRRMGDGKAVCFGTVLAIVSLLLFAAATDLKYIYLSNFLRGGSEVIILAASYAFASVLIPPEKRAKRFGIFNATFFLSWGLPSTFIAGPMIDLLLNAGAAEVFAYQMAFYAAVMMTAIGLAIQAFLVYFRCPKPNRQAA